MDHLSDDEKGWVAMVVPLLKGVLGRRPGREREGIGLIQKEFSVPGDAARYLSLLEVLYDELADPNRDWEYVLRSSGATEDAIIDRLESKAWSKALKPGKGFLPGIVKAIYFMVRMPEATWKWTNLARKIHTGVQALADASGRTSGDYAAGYLGTLLILAERGSVAEAQSVLRKIAEEGILPPLIHLSRSESRSYASCILSVLYLDQMQRNTSTSADPFSGSAYKNSNNKVEFLAGRDKYRKDISKGGLIDGTIRNVVELAQQAGISTPMPCHDSLDPLPLINVLKSL